MIKLIPPTKVSLFALGIGLLNDLARRTISPNIGNNSVSNVPMRIKFNSKPLPKMASAPLSPSI